MCCSNFLADIGSIPGWPSPPTNHSAGPERSLPRPHWDRATSQSESEVWKSFKASTQEDVLKLREAGFKTEEQKRGSQGVGREGNIFCSLLCSAELHKVANLETLFLTNYKPILPPP